MRVVFLKEDIALIPHNTAFLLGVMRDASPVFVLELDFDENGKATYYDGRTIEWERPADLTLDHAVRVDGEIRTAVLLDDVLYVIAPIAYPIRHIVAAAVRDELAKRGIDQMAATQVRTISSVYGKISSHEAHFGNREIAEYYGAVGRESRVIVFNDDAYVIVTLADPITYKPMQRIHSLRNSPHFADPGYMTIRRIPTVPPAVPE